MASDSGPIQLFVINFEHPEFKGAIATELEALRVGGEVRILDSLAVVKDAAGGMMAMRWSDLEETDGIPAGSVLGGLLGLELAEQSPVDAAQVARAIAADEPDEDERATLAAMFEEVPLGGAVVLLLIEHLWAARLGRAVRGAGGVLTGQQMIPEATMERIPAVLAEAAGDGR